MKDWFLVLALAGMCFMSGVAFYALAHGHTGNVMTLYPNQIMIAGAIMLVGVFGFIIGWAKESDRAKRPVKWGRQ